MAARRSRRGLGSVRKLPSGRYQARITGPDLKRYSAPVTFETKALAEAWIGLEARRMSDPDTWVAPRERLSAKALQQSNLEAERITFAAYAKEAIATRTVKGRPLAASTRLRYEGLLRKYLSPSFGDVALEDITPAMVKAWYESLPPSDKIRREAYTLGRSIMRDATGVHGPVPGRSIPFQIRGAGSGTSPKRNTSANAGEIAVILDTIRPEWRLMVLLAVWCGMRQGELIELRRSDIDLEAGVIHIRRALALPSRASKHVKAPKSQAGVRDQRIPAAIVPAIKEHLNSLVNGRDGLVFPARSGGYLNPSVLYGKPKGSGRPPLSGGWFAARQAAGRPDLRFHDLRSVGATLLAQNGASVAEIQVFLGDSTPTAAMRYVRATSARMDALTDRLSLLASGGEW